MRTVILKKKDDSKTNTTDTIIGSTANPLQPKQPANNPLQLQTEETATSQPKQNNTGLPDNLKAGVEALSGFSMDDVKVHFNSEKPTQLQALAYAQGTDIHIAPGQEKHLPHEAWHVVQQKQGRVQATMQMKQGIAVNDDKGLEEEADVMGDRAVQMKTVAHGEGCGCAGCQKAPAITAHSAPSQLTAVVQGKWKCNDCDEEGPGKPKKKCPECNSTNISEVQEGRQAFGTWWENLTSVRRQELLREHGSHEEEGGLVTKKNQGGGGKGNQHSNGVANAMKQIRKKYDRGEYD
ncbi:eCIS core domain-containing protein [Niastella populi]|uniref:eCIS core domain-containing protein n=1 Tax=Niastella populi TaxID=550983 RepID=A0A1V9GCT2_9BACT|nr:DUF4157 domain-containing protein [Niastella populi]OQP68268.1 hypothetical protein A4R26_00200 [Niastella populi]